MAGTPRIGIAYCCEPVSPGLPATDAGWYLN